MYGVDQCRICGTPIKPTNKYARDRQEEANRNPLIPEKEWRARGFLTSPTKMQIGSVPADGCCWPCGLKQMNKKYKYTSRRVFIFSAIIIVFGGVMYIVSYLPH